jgi:hypothetical protein
VFSLKLTGPNQGEGYESQEDLAGAEVLESPVLCDGDGSIAKYRKWFQQFYAS